MPARQRTQAIRSGKPNRSVACLQDCRDSVRRKTVSRRIRYKSSVFELTDATRQGSGPHCSILALMHSKHAVFGETICLRVRFAAYHSISVFETFKTAVLCTEP